MNSNNSKREDIFGQLYKSLFAAKDIESQSFEELDRELNASGIDTSAYYKKVDSLVNQYRTETLFEQADKIRTTLFAKISRLSSLNKPLPNKYEDLVEKLNPFFGGGQAEMALRNYEFTDLEDMKSLLETLETLESLENEEDET